MIRIVGGPEPPTPVMEVHELPPEEAAAALARLGRARKNLNWFSRHAEQIAHAHAGRHVCVAGEELFVGDDPREVFERAQQAHPEDADAVFSRYLRPAVRAVPNAN